jgi:hypothetical protein
MLMLRAAFAGGMASHLAFTPALQRSATGGRAERPAQMGTAATDGRKARHDAGRAEPARIARSY